MTDTIKIPLHSNFPLAERSELERALYTTKDEINDALRDKNDRGVMWWLDLALYLTSLEDNIKMCSDNHEMVVELRTMRNMLNLHLHSTYIVLTERCGVSYYAYKDKE